MPDIPHETLAGRPTGRMSEAEYEKERGALRVLHGDNSRQAAARRDQALAKLFARCGWTQDELAKKEGKSQQRIGQSLRFGRFLTFTTAVVNPDSLPNNLTEWRFRSYWDRTDKEETNERVRFAAIQRLMAAETAIRRDPRPPIGKVIVERFADDGEWHGLSTIARAIADGDEDHVAMTMQNMMSFGTFGAKAERRRYGTSFQYQIFRTAGRKTVSVDEIRTKLGPLIKALIAEGKKNMATMSPGTVAMLAVRLERQIDDWTK
jgi:hypothetical protein